MELRESYREGLKLAWKNGSFGGRLSRSALRIFTATCFRETSGEYLSRMNADYILPPIGYYYSLFHIGVAMLYLDYKTETKEIKHTKEKPLTHRKIIGLMNRKLVSRKFISKEFLDLLSRMKQLREQINYGFHGVHMLTKEEKFHGIEEEERIFLGTFLNEAYKKTGDAFDEAFEYISLISDAAGEKDNGKTIGGGLSSIISSSMEDLGDRYMSDDVNARVFCYLADKDLFV